MRKNWFKKAGTAAAGLILIGSLLAGCGSGSNQPAQGADEPQAQETETAENENAGFRTLDEIRESVGLTEEEEAALEIAGQCIIKVAEQLKM